MSNKVICQRLDALIVAIRRNLMDPYNVGTGFIVSREKGLILTCAHVVRDACGCQPADGLKVGVYFPRVTDDQHKIQWAMVTACLPDYEDDVILLKLDNGIVPVVQNLFGLGQATDSFDNDFYSYGFGRTGEKDHVQALPIHGHISSQIDEDRNLLIRRFALRTSNPVLEGHSGSPVLDMEINRIVGIIIQSNKDINLSLATDCAVLILDPFAKFGIPISDTPLPKEAARTPSDEVLRSVRDLVDSGPREQSSNIPVIVPDSEWVGREDLLRRLNDGWENPSKRVTTLIGLGGEGKSSLAQHWLKTIKADGVFWWSFYNRSGVNEFFEAAFGYLFGRTPKSNWALYLGALLYTGKYLFVLDGFEVMQHRDSVQYGEIISSDLQLFLEYFASPAHDSRCLITSRIPLNFGNYTTFADYDVDRLGADEGKALLRRLGVNDDDSKLDMVVQTWDGHALTLSLIGAYLHACHGGQVIFDQSIHIEDLPGLAGDERRAQQVQRVLSRYDSSLLDEAEQSFLLLFSIFRLPVRPDAFQQVFRSNSPSILKANIAAMSDEAFGSLIERLKGYRIVRYESNEDQYTIHPLIRDHYTKKLKGEHSSEIEPLHRLIKDYYLGHIPKSLDLPTLKDLTPLIEAMYHACCAAKYEEGFALYTREFRVIEGRNVPLSEIVSLWLGAYEVALSMLAGFFDRSNTSFVLQLSDPKDKSFVLKDMGFCHMHLGRLNEAADYYRRAIAGYREEAQWGQTSKVYYDLAMLHCYSGRLADSVTSAEAALSFVMRPDDPQMLEVGEFQENPTQAIAAWALLGFIDGLRGDTEQAELSFEQAKELHSRKMRPLDHASGRALYRRKMRRPALALERRLHRRAMRRAHMPVISGSFYAIYLWRTGRMKAAALLAKAYLKPCQQPDLVAERSRCYRILGDITASFGQDQHQRAYEYYNEAVKAARDLLRRDILIEGLSARGRLMARQGNTDAARSDLEEALSYAGNTYRICEADIRVGLGWMHWGAGDYEAANKETQAAERISQDIGYDWGRRDAGELLSLMAVELKNRGA